MFIILTKGEHRVFNGVTMVTKNRCLKNITTVNTN